jgi:hypothetical protein
VTFRASSRSVLHGVSLVEAQCFTHMSFNQTALLFVKK